MESCLERLKAYFDERGVGYEVLHHPTAYTAQELAAHLHAPGRHVAKVFMVEADGRPVMLVLSAPDRADLGRVRDMLGAQRVQRLQEKTFEQLFPDCDTGAMPPCGHFYGLDYWTDRALTTAPRVYFRAGDHRATMAIAGEDYRQLMAPQVADFAFQP